MNYRIATFEDFDADPTGRRDSTGPFNRAFREMAGGGVLIGRGVYRLKDDVELNNARNLLIDFNGCTIHGASNRRMYLNRCRGCRVTSLRVGQDEFNRFAGISLLWCEGCGLDEITKVGDTASSFVMGFCRYCTFSKLMHYDNGGICYLAHLSDNCSMDHCGVEQGELLYGFQIKGGEYNRVAASWMRDVSCTYGFRDRGDSPEEASDTGSKNYPYPWADGDWKLPDPRRASRFTVFEGLLAERLRGLAYSVQEAVGTTLLNVKARDISRHAVAFTRTRGGQERLFTLNGFHFEDVRSQAIVVQSVDTLPLDGVRISNGSLVRCKPNLYRNVTDLSLHNFTYA